MERLTEIKTHVTGFSYTDKKEGIFAQNVYAKLAAYEDSQMTPEEVQSLAKAKADGRLKILPAKPGDIIYRPEALQFCWVITKVEIYEDEIVFIDDSDNIFRPDDIGKTVFLSRKAAEKALGGGDSESNAAQRTTPGKICGDCEHFYVNRWQRDYFKCELWHQSNSSATDIRKKAEACGLWKERVSEDGSSKDE